MTTSQWDSYQGNLRRFERPDPVSPWENVGVAQAVVLGKKGLAWGIGCHGWFPAEEEKSRLKEEGDGCSPAGVFQLGESFGYDSLEKVGIVKIPYRQLTQYDEGIDDSSSRYYNKIMDSRMIIDKDWTSFETMFRPDGAYELGLVIQHNENNIPGKGSCIFMHVWQNDHHGTAGCTAMDLTVLNMLLHWLDQEKYPLLIQLPESEYRARQGPWCLPDLW
ncbi:MAG: L,D-transpeptidase family protein [Chthoniobacterales bacterium]